MYIKIGIMHNLFAIAHDALDLKLFLRSVSVNYIGEMSCYISIVFQGNGQEFIIDISDRLGGYLVCKYAVVIYLSERLCQLASIHHTGIRRSMVIALIIIIVNNHINIVKSLLYFRYSSFIN